MLTIFCLNHSHPSREKENVLRRELRSIMPHNLCFKPLRAALNLSLVLQSLHFLLQQRMTYPGHSSVKLIH